MGLSVVLSLPHLPSTCPYRYLLPFSHFSLTTSSGLTTRFLVVSFTVVDTLQLSSELDYLQNWPELIHSHYGSGKQPSWAQMGLT
jgi:hypothetical protein